MPLLKPTFQPFFYDPDAPFRKNCGKQYCYPVAAGDIVRQQYRQTPCSGNLVEDPLFEDVTVGANMISDGAFPCPAAAWTYGTGWSCSGNAAQYNLSGATHDTLAQAGIGLAAGTVYRIGWDQAFGFGQVAVRVGAAAASGSSPNGETGAIEVDILYNDVTDIIEFIPQETPFNQFSIDNVTCRPLTFANWDINNTWTLSDGKACKTRVGTSGKLINGSSDYMVSGDRYMAQVTVSGYAGGAVRMYVDDGTGATQTNLQTGISANGVYTYYFDAAQDGVIAFEPISSFIGCLSSINVQRLRNDYTFEVINGEGDSIDVSSMATYYEDRVLLNLDFAQLLEDGDIDDYGCFSIHVTDACLISGDDLVVDGDFDNADFSEWIRNMGDYQYAMTGGGVRFIFEPLGDNPNIITNPDFALANTDWSGDPDWNISIAGAQHQTGNTTPLLQSITIDPPAVVPNVLVHWWQIIVQGRTTGSYQVSINGVNSATYFNNGVITNFLVPTSGGAVDFKVTPSSDFNGTIIFAAVHKATRNWSAFPEILNPVNPSIVEGDYQISFDITAVSGTTAGTQGAGGYIQYPLPSAVYSVDAGSYSHIQSYTPGVKRIGLSGYFKSTANIYYPGTVDVDNLEVVRVEPFEATYESECLNFQVEHEDTILVTAYSDQEAYGLLFEEADYVLQMRINARSYNSDVDDESIMAKLGDGSSRLAYGQIEKFWQFGTDLMSESAHTTLACMIRCDHFMVGETGQDDTIPFLIDYFKGVIIAKSLNTN